MQGIYLASLDGGEPKRLAAADAAGEILRPDRIVFISQGGLVTRRFDLKRGESLGAPETLADHVGSNSFFHGDVSVADDGRIAYRATGTERTQLTWHDWTGNAVGTAGQPDGQGLLAPELSPDGRRVAADRTVQGNRDVWLIDLARGGLTRLTFGPSVDGFPIWAPGGTRVCVRIESKRPYGPYIRPSGPLGTEEAIAESPNSRWPPDWSKDGRFLLYHEEDPRTGADIWALPMTGSDRNPIVVSNTPFAELAGQFSPDGRWVAYDTNESGQFQIVVQPLSESKREIASLDRWWNHSTMARRRPGAVVHCAGWEVDGCGDSRLCIFVRRRDACAPVSNANQQHWDQAAVRCRSRRPLVMDDFSATPITLILNWKPGQEK